MVVTAFLLLLGGASAQQAALSSCGRGWECFHGGVCSPPRLPTTCTTAREFSALAGAVTAACCNGSSESCDRGAPRVCGAGCARVLVPMSKLCSAGIFAQQKKVFAVIKRTLDAAVAKCGVGSSGGHRRRAQQHKKPGPSCSCAKGYTGTHCESKATSTTRRAGFAAVESRIKGVTAKGLKFVEAALPKASRGRKWKLCYDSRTDCTTCPCAKLARSDGSCSCPSGKTSFHGGCDRHSATLVLGHNSLGFAFGGFAEASWAGSGYARGAKGDFLFRLVGVKGLGAVGPAVYRPTHRIDTYQYRGQGFWPIFGSDDDLHFGRFAGKLGPNGKCDQGPSATYGGQPNEACGGNGNWGATELEVWYRVGS